MRFVFLVGLSSRHNTVSQSLRHCAQNIPHSSDAVAIAWYTAKFFVDKARQSQHAFPAAALQSQIIYNYVANFTGAQGSDFEQIYFFNE